MCNFYDLKIVSVGTHAHLITNLHYASRSFVIENVTHSEKWSKQSINFFRKRKDARQPNENGSEKMRLWLLLNRYKIEIGCILVS